MEEKFKPKFFARSPFFQTVYGSLKIRKNDKHPVLQYASEIILDCGEGIRLLGYYTKQNKDESRGAVLLIHGWEGSSDSSYVKNTAKFLFDHKYDIFRLNLRDHGNSHHLNKGFFKSTLIDEAFTAVSEAAKLKNDLPFYIIGFSLGGNFALRIAIRGEQIPNLKHVIAVSPVLDPAASTKATDKTGIIRHYFLKKWKRSLFLKEKYFAGIYNFSDIKNINTIWKMTEKILSGYTEFKNTGEYFSKYTLLGDTFKHLKIPATIITSEDDPIIPVKDFYGLKTNGNLNIIIQPYGGHNGFYDFFPSRVWYHDKIYEIFSGYPINKIT